MIGTLAVAIYDCGPYDALAQPCPITWDAGSVIVTALLVALEFGLVLGAVWFFFYSLGTMMGMHPRSPHSLAYKREFSRMRRYALERDGYRCSHCGRTGPLHVHHRTPRSQGGMNNLSNLTSLCPDCHKAVHRGFFRVR